MKRFSVLILLIISLSIPRMVHAAYYENNFGLELTASEYSNLRKLYTDKFISTMNEEEYQKVANLDFNAIQKETIYIRSDYNQITGETTETEITESEYNAVGTTREEPTLRSEIVETNYKELILTLTRKSSESAYASTTVIWKRMPATTSYDVIGMRFVNFRKVNGTQGGKQIYMTSSGTSYVSYAPDGTNINNQSNGYGISMNIVDQQLTYLECTTDTMLTTDAYPAAVYGSYQHATSNITLAISKSYTLGSGGLGNVFIFSNNYSNYYDQMVGLYTGLSS